MDLSMRTILTATLLTLFLGSATADTPPTPTTAPPKPAPTATATDFASQAKLLFRVAACGGQDEIPERFSKSAITSHCKEMAGIYSSYKRAWADQAKKFIG